MVEILEDDLPGRVASPLHPILVLRHKSEQLMMLGSKCLLFEVGQVNRVAMKKTFEGCLMQLCPFV